MEKGLGCGYGSVSRIFKVYKILRDQRVSIASLFLMDKVDVWLRNWNRDGIHSWEEFEEAICDLGS